jgi:hypothetical protein
VDVLNPTYSSIEGVLFDKTQTVLIGYPGGRAGGYTIPDNVIHIGASAFGGCARLTGVGIPDSVASIEGGAFGGCTSLTSVVIPDSVTNIGYCALSGCLSLPTALWVRPNPVILTTAPSFGVQTNQSGFIISWATNASVVVEACTDLGPPIWSPVGTNTLNEGWSYFSDPQWTDYASHLYRIRSP